MAKKTLSLADAIERYNQTTLKIAFAEAVLELALEHFAHHDGMEPKSLVVTSDGRRVPESVIQEVLQEIKKKVLEPSQAEIQGLEKVRI